MASLLGTHTWRIKTIWHKASLRVCHHVTAVYFPLILLSYPFYSKIASIDFFDFFSYPVIMEEVYSIQLLFTING